MVKHLKKKWNVNGWRMLIILIVFALSGSTTAFLGRRLIGYLDIEMVVVETIVYFILISVIWPFTILIISIPFGQFGFFRNYISRIGNRLFTRKKN